MTTPNRQESAAETCPHGIALSDACQECQSDTEATRTLKPINSYVAPLEQRRREMELARQVLGLQARLQRAEADLTTSRAATDKTRQEADALLRWVGLARPVIEAVRAYQAAHQDHMKHYEDSLDDHMKAFNASIAALCVLREIPLPLPPKEPVNDRRS